MIESNAEDAVSCERVNTGGKVESVEDEAGHIICSLHVPIYFHAYFPVPILQCLTSLCLVRLARERRGRCSRDFTRRRYHFETPAGSSPSAPSTHI